MVIFSFKQPCREVGYSLNSLPQTENDWLMEKFKTIIVDDDEVSVESLRFELAKDPRFALEGVARNGNQGKKLIARVQPDLLFLDVELPDTTGMQLLQEMHDSLTWDLRVVFYTAYDKYMIEAIRQSAFDYLLKPLDEQELKAILDRFAAQADGPRPSLSVATLLPGGGQTFIVFTPTNDMRALRSSEIGFFRYCSDRKQWEVFLSNQPPLAIRRGMTAEQIVQYSPSFVQIHQSYIINIDYLMIIKDNKCLLYPPFNEVSELLVSRKYKKQLQERFCL